MQIFACPKKIQECASICTFLCKILYADISIICIWLYARHIWNDHNETDIFVPSENMWSWICLFVNNYVHILLIDSWIFFFFKMYLNKKLCQIIIGWKHFLAKYLDPQSFQNFVPGSKVRASAVPKVRGGLWGQV